MGVAFVLCLLVLISIAHWLLMLTSFCGFCILSSASVVAFLYWLLSLYSVIVCDTDLLVWL